MSGSVLAVHNAKERSICKLDGATVRNIDRPGTSFVVGEFAVGGSERQDAGEATIVARSQPLGRRAMG